MTADLTPEALDALAALDQAATPGPWERTIEGADVWVQTIAILDPIAQGVGDSQGEHDLALIAAMRNALPALIATAREFADVLRAVEVALGEASESGLRWALGELLTDREVVVPAWTACDGRGCRFCDGTPAQAGPPAAAEGGG